MPIPKYLREETPQKKGLRREKKACQTINSGRVWFDKGDLAVKESDEEYCVDVKDAEKQFVFVLKKIDKFYKEASPRTPVILTYLGPFIIKSIITRK